MARPYMEPKMRERMAGNGGNPMSEDSGANTPGESAPQGSEQTFFVKKSMLGGKMWKAGDEIVFVFKAIDPETGDGELYYAPEKGGSEEEQPADSMEAMDKTFPAPEEESQSMSTY